MSTNINKLMEKLNDNQAAVYEGVCQVCFGNFVVEHSTRRQWHLVLHGYRRPGDGAVRGSCPGVDEAPYELSCEVVKLYLAQARVNCENRGSYLKDLKADKVESFLIDVEIPYRERTNGGPKSKPVRIYRDSKPMSYWETFEYARSKAIKDSEREIRNLVDTINYLDDKVRNWKLAPEALQDHEKAEIERIRRSKEERERRQFIACWKRLWKNIGEAIRTHKRLTEQAANGSPSASASEVIATIGPFVRVKVKKGRK